MSKTFDKVSVLTLSNNAPELDKEAVKAQRQWVKDGTVSAEYLRHVLGDISVGVSPFIPSNKEKSRSRTKHKP